MTSGTSNGNETGNAPAVRQVTFQMASWSYIQCLTREELYQLVDELGEETVPKRR